MSWDGDGTLLVMVSQQFEGHVCGMCGDYDGDPADDLTDDLGGLTTDVDSFAKSWNYDVSR